MLQLLGIIAAIFSAVCYFPYIRDILFGKTRPEKATWLIWVVLGCIAFFSQLAKGATNSLWLPGIETLGQIIVLLLSLKMGDWEFKKKDIVALSIAGLGLILWYFTKEAAIALYIVIGIDLTGTSLTIQKAYKEPETETLSTWILAMFGGFFSAFAVGSLNIVLLSYPIFVFTMNGVIALAMILGRKRKPHRK